MKIDIIRLHNGITMVNNMTDIAAIIDTIVLELNSRELTKCVFSSHTEDTVQILYWEPGTEGTMIGEFIKKDLELKDKCMPEIQDVIIEIKNKIIFFYNEEMKRIAPEKLSFELYFN